MTGSPRPCLVRRRADLTWRTANVTTPERSAADSTTVMKPDHPATEDLWSGHSRFLAFWEAGVAVVLVFCAVVTVLTTVGIMLVLSIQTVRVLHGGQGRSPGFLLGTELKPDATPPSSASCPLAGERSSSPRLVVHCLADRPLECDLPERIRPAQAARCAQADSRVASGIPTIVYGYLALLLVTPVLRRSLNRWESGCGSSTRCPPASWSGS